MAFSVKNTLSSVKDWMFPIIAPNTKGQGQTQFGRTDAGGSPNLTKNLGNAIFPSSLEALRRDVQAWREAKEEAESGWIPYRTKMMKMYEDTILNEHVFACIQRRKNLTLLRKFEIQIDGKVNEEWTKYFSRTWFRHKMLNYILDAQFYGFNLVSIGDIKNGIPENPVPVRRWMVSPDRNTVSAFEYNPAGYDFLAPPYEKWHIWIPTITTNAMSTCGYGLLYNIAKTEILLRNNLAFNTDFIEMFAQPFRLLKTAKTEGAERDAAEKSLIQMGSAGYMITDLQDELEFLTDGSRGNGYKSYNDFEDRNQKKISKVLLGHSDAIDSVPGKLGASQVGAAGDKTDISSAASPVAQALRDIQTSDGAFVEPIVNEQVITKLRAIGIPIPKGASFKFLNDAEDREILNLEASKNQRWATLALTLAQAGFRPTKEELESKLGIDIEEVQSAVTDNNVKDVKEIAEGKEPLKEEAKKRTNKPKKTKLSE